MSPLISIIVPVHNAKETLAGAVNSVMCQTIRKGKDGAALELLLVDDGSEDESGRLCDSYAEETGGEIRVIHMEDEGVSEARNRGIDAARGEFITFLDADDAMEPSMLEELYALHRRTGAEICGCGFCRVTPKEAAAYAQTQDRSGAGSGENALPEAGKAAPDYDLLEGRGVIRDGILQGDTRVWSKLFARELIGEKRFQKGLTIGEDLLFVMSLIGEKTRYASSPAPLYRYTVNPKGAMERPFVPSYMDQLRCYEEAEALLLRNMPGLLADKAAAGRLCRLRITAEVLTAMKIARLPAAERRRYTKEFETCRAALKEQLQRPGTAALLSQDYRRKAFLLRYLPAAFGLMTRAAARRKKSRKL